MKHLYFYYILGVMNFHYDKRKQCFTSSRVITALKTILHVVIPNAVLLAITLYGKNGIRLTIPSVHMVAFIMRIVWTFLTMDVTILLNYYFTGIKQRDLLNECLACLRDAKSRGDDGKTTTFRSSRIVLAIFLLHYINYEINQYTYVLLYDEKWPELTFYVMLYFMEMVTVMIALYFATVLDIVHRTVTLDVVRLKNCLQQNPKNEPFQTDDPYWWRMIEHYYQRVLSAHQRRRAFCRAFQLQLVTIALNTFICSFAIFYVNLNYMLVSAHTNALEIYKRVTESLGFFPQLIALLLICRHASKLESEQRNLTRLIIQTQSRLTTCAANMRRCNVFISRLAILQNQMKISPYNLFDFDLGFFYGIVAAIVTYLVVLLQFRVIEFT